MIYTTQGHEKGIGLEIYLKSLLTLSSAHHENFELICFKQSLKNTLETLDYNFHISGDQLTIDKKKFKLRYCSESHEYSQSLIALEKALELAGTKDIIHTLPTSKSSLKKDGIQFKGHTDFLEKNWGTELTMCFLASDSNFLLLTDHIPIDQVFEDLKAKELAPKILNAINSFPKSRVITELFISGLNPHIGEDGVISNQDKLLYQLVKSLPIPTTIHSGDTMHFNIRDASQLFIYCFHDQGLGVFKALYGLKGINFSAGYPIKRVSVDHGTAFDIFGKNIADCSGIKFLLNEIVKW